MKPFGFYWEVVHEASGEVVNDGFFTNDGELPESFQMNTDRPKGFTNRTTPVYREAQPDPAMAVDAQSIDTQGEQS